MHSRRKVLIVHCERQRGWVISRESVAIKMTRWPNQDSDDGLDGEGRKSTESTTSRIVTFNTRCTLELP